MLIQLKDNQRHLLEDVILMAQNKVADDVHACPPQKVSGRITTRTASVYHSHIANHILDEGWASLVKSVVCIERDTQYFDTQTKTYKSTAEKAWYLSSTVLGAKEAGDYVLGHWGIENRNNYVRDVTLKEDEARIRKKAANMAMVRSFALNIMRNNNAKNIKEETYNNALNWRQLYSYPQLI